MAGTNQAANLSGMLSSFASDMSRPVDISSLTNNIRDMARPNLDMNDPESLEQYAAWAGRTGRADEAQTYGALAASKREETKSLNQMRATDAVARAADGDVRGGDTNGLEKRISQLQDQLATASADTRPHIQRAIAQLQGRRQEAKGTRTAGNVSAAQRIDELLTDETLEEAQVRQLERSREAILKQDPETQKAYDKQFLDTARANEERYTLQQTQANREVVNLVYGSGKTDAELEQIFKTLPPSQRKFAETELAQKQARVESALLRKAQIEDLSYDPTASPSEVLETYKELDASMQTEAGRSIMGALEKLRENKPEGLGTMRAWRSKMAALEGRLYSQLTAVESEQRAVDRAEKKAQDVVENSIKRTAATYNPSDADIIGYVIQNFDKIEGDGSSLNEIEYNESTGRFKKLDINRPGWGLDDTLTREELVLKYQDKVIPLMRQERLEQLSADMGYTPKEDDEAPPPPPQGFE